MTTKTHTERALITLRQRIMSGAYAGGQRLFEVALAEDLQISRTPIRSALSKLAEEGLLDRKASGGFAVRKFDLRDVTDTIELRGVLEGTAARLAAEAGTGKDILDRAENAVQKIDSVLGAESVDMSLYSRWNSIFHDSLAHASGSRVLMREIARVTALPFASPSAFLDDESQTTRFLRNLLVANEQHRAIIEAIAARQGARAESLAREHARAALQNVEFLTSNEAAMREGSAPLALVST